MRPGAMFIPAGVDAKLEWELCVDFWRRALLSLSQMSSLNRLLRWEKAVTEAWEWDLPLACPSSPDQMWKVAGGRWLWPSLVWWQGKSQHCFVLWFAFQMFHIINHYGGKLVKNIEKKVANDEFVTAKEWVTGADRKGFVFSVGKGLFWRAFSMLQHVSLVSYGSKFHSSHEHGMFLSTGLAVLCSNERAVPFPHFILLGMHFEEGSISRSFSRSCMRYSIFGCHFCNLYYRWKSEYSCCYPRLQFSAFQLQLRLLKLEKVGGMNATGKLQK